MSSQQAVGMIETKGLISAIEAADIMVKTANVNIEINHKPGGGLVCILCTGDVASCKVAVDAAASAAQKIGQLVSCHVIPRLDESINIEGWISTAKERKEAKKNLSPTKKTIEAEIKTSKKTVSPKKSTNTKKKSNN